MVTFYNKKFYDSAVLCKYCSRMELLILLQWHKARSARYCRTVVYQIASYWKCFIIWLFLDFHGDDIPEAPAEIQKPPEFMFVLSTHERFQSKLSYKDFVVIYSYFQGIHGFGAKEIHNRKYSNWNKTHEGLSNVPLKQAKTYNDEVGILWGWCCCSFHGWQCYKVLLKLPMDFQDTNSPKYCRVKKLKFDTLPYIIYNI